MGPPSKCPRFAPHTYSGYTTDLFKPKKKKKKGRIWDFKSVFMKMINHALSSFEKNQQVCFD